MSTSLETLLLMTPSHMKAAVKIIPTEKQSVGWTNISSLRKVQHMGWNELQLVL